MSNANWNIFCAAYPAESAYLEANADNNSFLKSLYEQVVSKGDLSPRQIECVQQNMPKDVEEQNRNIRLFTDTMPEIADYLFSAAATGKFMDDLRGQVANKGGLSEKQIAAIEKNMAQTQQRNSKWAMSNVTPVSTNVKPIYDAFATMQANGLKKPKLRFDGFSLALGQGNVVWVNGPDRETYGRIHCDGVFFPSKICPAEIAAEILMISTDVIGAAKRYGHASGNCSACGRHLDRAESIKMGIGPICAERMGLGAARAVEEAKRKAAGSAAEYLMEGAQEVEADLPEVEPLPEPDYTPATLEDRESEGCSADEYLAAKLGEV